MAPAPEPATPGHFAFKARTQLTLQPVTAACYLAGMRRPYPTLLALASIFAVMAVYDVWRGHRNEACEQRASRLLTVGVLRDLPDGVIADEVHSSCDYDRDSAVANRRFGDPATFKPVNAAKGGGEKPAASSVTFSEVIGFVKQAAERDGWTVTSVASARDDDRGALCAEKQLWGERHYLRLHTHPGGEFDMAVAEWDLASDCS